MNVILLSGKQGSGKTTVGSALETRLRSAGYGLIRHRFAAPVYEAHDAVLSVLRPLGILPDTKKDGRLLQLIGTDWGRAIDPDIWIKAAKARISTLQKHFLATPIKIVVLIEDNRFKNEFDAFPESLRVRLECPEVIRRKRTTSWREDTGHQSETDLDDYVTQCLFDVIARTDTQDVASVVDTVYHAFIRKFQL
jgi:hypothetical protein